MRIYQYAAYVSAAATVALAAFAVKLYLDDIADDPGDPALRITATVDVGPLAVGEEVPVIFRMHNPSDEPVEIHNFIGVCSADGCLDVADGAPQSVPAGATVDLPCVCSVHRPGPFEATATAYLIDGGMRSVVLTARGEGVAADADKE